MLIAITSTGKDLTSLIAESFGRSEFFILFNSDENSYHTLRNPFSGLLDGAGIQTAQFIIENNVSVVISRNFGVKSLKTLKSAEVKTFICDNCNSKKVLEKFAAGELKEIEELPKYPNKTLNDNLIDKL